MNTLEIILESHVTEHGLMAGHAWLGNESHEWLFGRGDEIAAEYATLIAALLEAREIYPTARLIIMTEGYAGFEREMHGKQGIHAGRRDQQAQARELIQRFGAYHFEPLDAVTRQPTPHDDSTIDPQAHRKIMPAQKVLPCGHDLGVKFGEHSWTCIVCGEKVTI